MNPAFNEHDFTFRRRRNMARQIAVINKSKGWESTPARRILKYTVLTILLVASFVLVAHRDAALADSDSRWLTPTMINARANMFDPNLNYLTFQYLDTMFASRMVHAGGEVWKLPSSPVSIKAEFEFKGGHL